MIHNISIRFYVKELLKASGSTVEDLCKLTDIPQSDFEKWMDSYDTDLSSQQYIAIADYFGVSLDFLYGRLDIPLDKTQEYYLQMKYDLLKQPLSSEQVSNIAERYYFIHSDPMPYPYNMVLYIADGYMPLNEDQMNGIDAALNALTEEERTAMLLRYKEHLSIAKVGKSLHTTTGKARIILYHAFAKMRRPPLCDWIQYGREGSKYNLKMTTLRDKENALNKKENDVKTLELLLTKDLSKLDYQQLIKILYQIFDINLPEILDESLLTYIDPDDCRHNSLISQNSISTVRDAIVFDVKNNHSFNAWLSIPGYSGNMFIHMAHKINNEIGYMLGSETPLRQTALGTLAEYLALKGTDEELPAYEQIKEERTSAVERILNRQLEKPEEWAKASNEAYGFHPENILDTPLTILKDQNVINASLCTVLSKNNFVTVRDVIQFDLQYDRRKGNAWKQLQKMGNAHFEKLQRSIYTYSGYKIGLASVNFQSPMGMVTAYYAEQSPKITSNNFSSDSKTSDQATSNTERR